MKLGQIFLKSSRIAKKIINLANLTWNDTVIEIGAGKGILTYYLLNKAPKVIAVEIDTQLCKYLEKKFSNFPNFILINDDILKISIKKLKEEFNLYNGKIKIIGNIPFNITSPLLDWLIAEKDEFEFALLMVQKEFAERLLANAGNKKYGKITVMCELFFERKGFFEVNKKLFFPPPKVNAFIIKLISHKKKEIPLQEKDFEEFKNFINDCFAYKRKTLVKSLQLSWRKKKVGSVKKEIINILGEEGIPLNVRAEQINLNNLFKIYNRVKVINKQ